MTAGSQESPVELPMPYPLEHPVLEGGAAQAARQLMDVADNQPALKLDVTETQVTLTVLDPERTPTAYRWMDNQISAVDSDMQYFGQATFYPGTYPLGNVRRLFETANLLGAGEDLGGHPEATILAIWEKNPLLRQYLGTPDNPELVLYRLVPARVRFMREWALEYHEVPLAERA